MRIVSSLTLIALLGSLLGCGASSAAPEVRVAAVADPPADIKTFEVTGKTQALPGKKAEIAPTVLHPVEKVFVTAGMRVKKDQPLVEIDRDEPLADMKAKEATFKELKASLSRLKAEPRDEEQNEARANLENARVCAREARHLFDRVEVLYQRGSTSEQRFHEARRDMLRCQADERASAARLERLLKRPFALEVAELEARVAAAEQNLKSAQAELDHYTVTAPIDGVVSTLDVYPGTVSRPGTSLWGEILDLSEIDVRCELTPQQADRVTVGQIAEVVQPGRPAEPMTGRVVFLGIAADPRTGFVPALVRLNNARERLRCYVDVKVRFTSIQK